jgi:hypothetical protein
MSICCGYLFFQRDTVYFLRLYFNPNWLEISPLEWPTPDGNPTVREGADLLFMETGSEYLRAPSLTVGSPLHLPLERSKSSSRF